MTNFIRTYLLLLCLFPAIAASPAWASNPPQIKKQSASEYKLKENDVCKLPVFLNPSAYGWTWDTTLATMPVNGIITSSFGPRKISKRGATRVHKGIDISAPRGSDIVASADGVVIFVGTRRGYGKVVDIDHGCGIITRYAHMDTVDVENGAQVKAGQKIAEVGRTGRTTGPCLHFETIINGEQVDPLVVCQWATFVADSGKHKKNMFPSVEASATAAPAKTQTTTTIASVTPKNSGNKKSASGKSTRKSGKNTKSNKELQLASKKTTPPSGYVNTLP